MSALRCSTCGVNYDPARFRRANCPRCGEPLSILRDAQPDPNPDTTPLGDEEYILTPSADARFYDADRDPEIVGHRLRAFLDLGFSDEDAYTMALRKDIDRARVDFLIVRHGATHAQALRVLL